MKTAGCSWRNWRSGSGTFIWTPSTPVLRNWAYHTAEAVNRYHRLPIHTDGRLMEINGRALGGEALGGAAELYPSKWEDWSERPWRFEAEGGEPMREVYRRMAEALTDIAAAHPGEAVAAASHGCAIRNALCWASGPAYRKAAGDSLV